jgi:hypothetical protein
VPVPVCPGFPPLVFLVFLVLVFLRWGYVDIETGDQLKVTPAGMLTIFRGGSLVAQRTVSAMAVRSFERARWIQPV